MNAQKSFVCAAPLFWLVLSCLVCASGFARAQYITSATGHAAIRSAANEAETAKIGKPIDLDKDSVNWRFGGLLSVNLNQGSLTNWAAGGDNFSLAFGSLASVYLNYANGKNRWDNDVDMAFGYINTSSLGMRKSDDKIDLYSKYGYQFAKSWFYSAMLNFKSQFANGYLYPDDSTVVSHFLAPGYLIGSLGFDFQPNKHFSMFISPLSSRFTFVEDQTLADQGAYGVDSARYLYFDSSRVQISPGRKLLYQLGAFASIQYNKEILPHVNWMTRLDLYTNYLYQPQYVAVDWNSLLTLKVNKFITTSLNTELIYDHNIRFVTYAHNPDGSVKKNPETGAKVIESEKAKVQFKELIGLGFAYKF